MDSYEKFFRVEYDKIINDMMRFENKAFTPIGLELLALDVYFKREADFALKGMTFAYFSPVDNAIYINIDDLFFKDASATERSAKLFFILFHEVMHKILDHTKRSNERHSTLWNVAGDYEIHNTYYMYANCIKYEGVDQLIADKYLPFINKWMIDKGFKESPQYPAICFSMDYLDKIAEEIYEMIQNSKTSNESSMEVDLDDLLGGNDNGDGDGNKDGDGENPSDGDGEGKESKKKEKSGVKVKVTKTTYKLPDGNTYTDVDIEWPKGKAIPDKYKMDEKEEAKHENTKTTNRALLENTMTKIGQGKGDLPAPVKKFLKKLFHIKVDWEKILRNSLHTALDKSDYFAWSKIRTSAFLLPNMSYLPDIVEDDSKYGTLIISRDESGSMTEEMIQKAAAIIMEAKDFYKKIIVLKHDTAITSVAEFEDLTTEAQNSLMTRDCCGGTSHKAVFEWIRDYAIKHRDDKISCYIGITDMESDIEVTQKILPGTVPVIYLTPMNYDKHYSKDINGKIIPIEL